MSEVPAYEFERARTGGIRVYDPVRGERLTMIPQFMARDLFEFMKAEEAVRTSRSEETR